MGGLISSELRYGEVGISPVHNLEVTGSNPVTATQGVIL